MNQEFIYAASVVLAVLVLMLWALGVFDEPRRHPQEVADDYARRMREAGAALKTMAAHDVFPEPNYRQRVYDSGQTITPEGHPLWGPVLEPGQRPTVAQLRGRLASMRMDGSADWPVSEGETIGDAIERHIADRLARGEL